MEKSKYKVKKFDLQFCRDDCSDGKIATQSELAKNSNYFKEISFTKKVLQVFGKAYGLNLQSKLKKDDMNRLPTQKVLECDKFLNPEVFVTSSHEQMHVTVEEHTTTSDLSTLEVVEPGSLEQTNASEDERQLSQQSMVIDASQQSVSELQISRTHLPHTRSIPAGTSTSELPSASETDVVKDNKRPAR
jgi:hypothetical protein